MQIHISTSDGVPIYLQIVNQIKYLIAAGRLSPGEEIPPIRVLAEQLLINPNTVARAYQDLERMGVLETKRGRGMEVTVKAPALCDARRREIIRDRVRDALHEAVASGLTADDVRSLVEDEWARLNGRARRRGREERT